MYVAHSRGDQVDTNFTRGAPYKILEGKNVHNSARFSTSRYIPETFAIKVDQTPKVIGAHVWNFKPNFKCWALKFLRGSPTPIAVCASKPWPVSSVCKNFSGQHLLRAEI